jgi:peptidoglycan/xylan/chitin deacetylase (PgdA/CDA1 family)
VVVITLHRVLEDDAYATTEMLPGMAVRASTFTSLLEYIARHCEWVLPQDAARPPAQEAVSRRPRIALTFDDGWRDNFDVAFPISRKCRVPFTVFLCPQVMNRHDSFWTDKLHDLWWAAYKAGDLDRLTTICAGQDSSSADSLIQGLKHVPAGEREALIAKLQASFPLPDGMGDRSRRLLTWSEVKHMAEGGVSFGSHTDSHAILTDISRDEAVRELTGSKSSIEAQVNDCALFAYPNGDWSPSVRELVAQSGYRAAFINRPGIWCANDNQFSIPRINVWEGSLTGSDGRFSRMALEYAIFWKANRAYTS